MYMHNNQRTIKMADESMLDNTLASAPLLANPYELELQSWCKRTLKHRIFRGIYLERRYVENIKDYRDVIGLHKTENSFNKTLHDVLDKLRLFYRHQNCQIWIGITSGTLKDITTPREFMLDTYLWVDIKDLAFGHYWFSIKTIRFLNNEIILTLKVGKPVEEEGYAINTCRGNSVEPAKLNESAESHVTIKDFKLLLQEWQESTKRTIYNFMSHGISKENIKTALKFLGLIVLSLISIIFVGVKYLGLFSLRFMQEFNRLVYVSTPIIIKLIDVFTKIVGAFFILFTMIWKDIVGNRKQRNNSIQYNRPMYRRSIRYDVRQ